MIVEGQVHGGLVQGIGQALLECAVYDENGQLKTGSWITPCHAPTTSRRSRSPQPVHPARTRLGVKGCGEGRAIGAPPAVINAICDALAPYGVTYLTCRRRRRGLAGDQCRWNEAGRRITEETISFDYQRPASIAEAVSLAAAS